VVKKPDEFQIQRALCIWLDTPGVLRPNVVYWHTPNGGARSPIEGKRFKEIGVKAGVHDLLFLAEGRLYGLEMKAEGGILSPAQIAMHPRLLAAGLAGSAVADSLAMAKDWVRHWGLTVPAATDLC